MRQPLHVCGIIAVFTLLTVIHTWPLATDLTHLSRMDAADAQLNAWAISWVAHRLPRDPLHLFDANIFHPERHTLAYSEPLLVPALIGAPLHWLGASPVLVHNMLTMVGLVAMALGMYLLTIRFTDDRVAAIIAGCLFAFNAHTLTRFPQLQAFHTEWLPLALWALDRLLTDVRYRDAWWLALFVTCSALTSGYMAVFVVVALAAAFIVRPDRWLHRRGMALAVRLVAASLASAAVVAFVLWPYAVANQGGPIRRTLGEVSMFSATLDQYLSTAGRLHYWLWSHQFFSLGRDALFPGVVAVVLACIALVTRRSQQATWMFGSVALTGLVLSFGTATPVYEWLFWVFPPVQSLRATSRFGFLFLLGVAGLAGLGLAGLRSRWGGRAWITAVAFACLLLVNLEALRAPVPYSRFAGFSPIYRAISRDPEVGAVVEFPFPPRAEFARNASYVLASTVHWRPLLNGYSGFAPASYGETADRLQDFPDPPAVRFLRDLGVTYVVVHPQRFRGNRAVGFLRRVGASRDLQFQGMDDEGSRLYRLRGARE